MQMTFKESFKVSLSIFFLLNKDSNLSVKQFNKYEDVFYE